MVELAVEDDGPGIPDAKLDGIFDRFYSERPQSEQFGSHSGLGLSISRQIVEAHGGRIAAENRRDEEGHIVGARFVYVTTYWKEEFAGGPFREVFMVQHGGLVYYGGLIGAHLKT